ncbi:MAG: pyridoxal phosphate-dependent aminotransferase [Actinomycetales bacterium]|nr:pyridoxal phosphate-dependent aminotransferase [Actinomycetales bacterium]
MTTRLTLAPRVDAVSASATLAVDGKAKRMRAAGMDVIGFGAGEPDFPTPEHIVEAARQACGELAMQKYGPTAGLPALREAIAAKTLRDSGYAVTAEQVVVTNGGKHAVFAALAAVAGEGDEVLLPAPYWNTYEEAAKYTGATVVVVPGAEENGFRVTVEQLEAALTPRTKVLAFVSPSNPTGSVYSQQEIKDIGSWALANDLWVVTDEIYEHLVYGETAFHSLPVEVPELAERTIVVNGVAKSFSMTGWRVGWLIGPPRVADAAERLQSHLTSHVAHVSQRAALAAVSGGLDDTRRMHAAFQRRRDTIHSLMTQVPGVTCRLPEGAFYVFPSFRSVIGRSFFGTRVESTLQLADLVLDRARVAFVPGEAFGAPGYGRFSYALADDLMVEGVQRIIDAFGRGLE